MSRGAPELQFLRAMASRRWMWAFWSRFYRLSVVI